MGFRISNFALVSVLVAAGCGTASSPSSESADTTSAAATAPITYETIVDWVRTRNIRSVDALLSQPELTPAFRRGFTMVYGSRSVQYADPLNPRVILYGEDAKLVLAFTCAPGDCGALATVPGGEHLELVQWREASKGFEYRDIAFPETGAGEPVFSGPNPGQCLGCHGGSDPRPNFDPYNQWPGFYGGNDDGAQPTILAPGESREKLDQFLATGPQRPRYRNLHELVDGYQYIYSYGGKTYTDPRTSKNHNIDINEALYFLNDTRIVDRLEKLPFFDDVKHAVMLGLSGDSLSDPLRESGQAEIAVLVDQCTSSDQPVSRVIKLLYGLGADSLPWFMSFGSGLGSELVAPAFGVEGRVEHELVTHDPELQADRGELMTKAKAGWARLLATLPVRDGFARCASQR
jgi:hypothetical protein